MYVQTYIEQMFLGYRWKYAKPFLWLVCLYLIYHLFFHMMDGPLFILPVSDHGQLAVNNILLL